MSTYAIVESGGKQYRVEEGQSLLVDRISEDEGSKVILRPVMLRTDDDVVLGGKDLEKVKVEAKVAGHERGEKIKVFKYKAKKGYRRRAGHRSELTKLEVTEVKLLSRKPAGASKKVAEKSADGPLAEKGEGTKEAKAKAPAKSKAKTATTKKAAPAAKKKAPAAKKATAKKPAAKKPASPKRKSTTKATEKKEGD